MNPYPHKQRSELLLCQGRVGPKQWTPTPTNKAVNYFNRGGCDQHNEPPPPKTRQWTPALLGVGGAKTMNAHPHEQGSELLLYQEWMGQKQWTPTPTNKAVHSCFTRGGWGINNEPPPPQKRQWTPTLPGVGGAKTMNPAPTNNAVNFYFTRGGWGLNNEPSPHKQRSELLLSPGVGGAKTMNPHPHKQGSDLLLYQGWVGPKQWTPTNRCGLQKLKTLGWTFTLSKTE